MNDQFDQKNKKENTKSSYDLTKECIDLIFLDKNLKFKPEIRRI